MDEELPPGDELSFGGAVPFGDAVSFGDGSSGVEESSEPSPIVRLVARLLAPRVLQASSREDSAPRRRLGRLRRLAPVALAGVAVVTAVAVVLASAPEPEATPVVYAGGHISNPDAIVVTGDDVWVSNYGTSTVTEIDTSTGATVRVLSRPHVALPWALASDGTHLWVASAATVDEFSLSDGRWIRGLPCTDEECNPGSLIVAGGRLWTGTMAGYSLADYTLAAADVVSISGMRIAATPGLGDYGLSWLSSMAAQGPSVWATVSTLSTPGHGGLIEFSAATGKIVRAIPIDADQSMDLGGIVADGPHLWVANAAAGTVVEISASTGQVERTLSYGFHAVVLQQDGPDIFAVNTGGNSVTEFSASTGRLIRVYSGPAYGFDGPDAIAFQGNRAWVTNFGGGQNAGSLTEFPVTLSG